MYYDVEMAGVGLLFLLSVSAISIAVFENLLVNTVIMGAFSITMAVLYLTMAVPDVAITEASVGAGLGTVLTLVALARLKYDKDLGVRTVLRTCSNIKLLVVLGVSGLMFASLTYAVLDLPAFGDKLSPANTHVASYYMSNTYRFMGIPNVVTAILASFRGYDTLCETTVVFLAAVCVSLLLSKSRSIS